MEVNDRPIQSGGDDENMTKDLKAEVVHSWWLFTCSFFNELKHGEKHFLMTYVYFLMSLNYVLKLLEAGLFFNELEPCGNTARCGFIF